MTTDTNRQRLCSCECNCGGVDAHVLLDVNERLMRIESMLEDLLGRKPLKPEYVSLKGAARLAGRG